jgi:MFS family permease
VRFFVVARLSSTLAQSLLAATISWHVFALTGSYFHLGLLGVVEFVPVVPFTLLGGAVADTRDRKRISMAARAATALLALLLWRASGGSVELPLILVAAFAVSVAGAFESPASSALLPTLVPRDIFQNAVVLSATARNVGFVTGPVVTGFAVERAGVGLAYAIAAAFFALSVLALAPLRRRGAAGAGTAVSLAAIREGIGFVGRSPVVLGSMTLDMFAVIFASVTALLPVFATEILDVGPRGYGLLSASMSIGTFAMTAILLIRSPFQRPGRSLLVAVLFFGLATLAFGLSRSFALSVLALVVAGMADQVSMTARATIIQLSTPDALRGRVSSVNMVFIGASNELGAAESGFLAALTSATFSVVFGGLACLGVLGAVAVRVPALRSWRIPGDAAEVS